MNWISSGWEAILGLAGAISTLIQESSGYWGLVAVESLTNEEMNYALKEEVEMKSQFQRWGGESVRRQGVAAKQCFPPPPPQEQKRSPGGKWVGV